MRNQKLQKLVLAALMAALCYVGYAVFPAIDPFGQGVKIHVGNAFVVLGAYLLGGIYGGAAGAVGLSIADLTQGYVTSAPRTFITKFVIGIVVGLVFHTWGKATHKTEPQKVLFWSILAAVAALGFNCIFEPALKYVWFTLLFPDPEKAASAIKAMMAVTTSTTLINAGVNSVAAVVLYSALRPALRKAGMFMKIGKI